MIKYIKSDLGIEERLNGEDFRDEPVGLTAGSQLRRRILSQNLIDRYFQRKLITPRQYNTANYLYTLYQKGIAKSSMALDIKVNESRKSFDNSSTAYSDYMRAMRKLPTDLFQVVQYIVIEGSTATSLDQKEYASRRVSMNKLRDAIDKLSNYFGIY